MESLEAFKELVGAGAGMPVGLGRELRALWLDKAGDWAAAHELVDSASDPAGCWVHAYLHRVEGDEWNAGYWYERAGKSLPSHLSLAEEWDELVTHFLAI